MGATGALIMSFFGAVFAALTMSWQWHLSGWPLGFPFIVFALIAGSACYVLRAAGQGVEPSPQAERAILWSSAGEGVGLFLAANIVVNLHRPELLLPAMALVVGVHFLPIAFAASFRPFYVLAAALILSAITGFVLGTPTGGALAGLMAAACLWIAAGIAVARDWRAKRAVAVNI